MTDNLTRYVVYTIFRDETDVESLETARLHSERTLPYRSGQPLDRVGAYDLTAVYLMTLMGQGATVREVSEHRWLARFADSPARDELVVVLPHDQEFVADPVGMWVDATSDRSVAVECGRCGGPWGEDLTCEDCCDDDGNARPHPQI